MICYEGVCSFMWLGFFFKQKTAYDVRISDWSSDVCSSDLVPFHAYTGPRSGRMPRILTGVSGVCSAKPTERMKPGCTPVSHVTSGVGVPPGGKIGRASCRERVCQYV